MCSPDLPLLSLLRDVNPPPDGHITIEGLITRHPLQPNTTAHRRRTHILNVRTRGGLLKQLPTLALHQLLTLTHNNLLAICNQNTDNVCSPTQETTMSTALTAKRKQKIEKALQNLRLKRDRQQQALEETEAQIEALETLIA